MVPQEIVCREKSYNQFPISKSSISIFRKDENVNVVKIAFSALGSMAFGVMTSLSE
jgi:hypothetical protein